MIPVHLVTFDNTWYHPGRSRLIQIAWFAIGLPLLRNHIMPFSSLRVSLLRWFGARIGVGAVIKPGVRVKYPWLLEVGDYCWIGEDAWIDNIALVQVGHDVCLSQACYLCTGNHDWTDPAFGLIARPIRVCDGAWVGARALICPGVTIGPCGVAAAGSVVTRNIPRDEIHAGNPSRFVRVREIRADPIRDEMRCS